MTALAYWSSVSRREVREKIAEWEQSGELAARIAEADKRTGGFQRPPRQ